MGSEAKPDPYLAEVRRMGGLEFTPQTPEAWVELAKILRRFSKSAEHASRIVSRFLEAGAPMRCPTPGELAQMAQHVPADAKFDRPDLPASCEHCAPYGGNYALVDGRGMRRCECNRGKRLAELDAQRAQPTERKTAKMERPDWGRLAAGDRD